MREQEMDAVDDFALRESLFQYVDRLIGEHGESIPYGVLRRKFQFRDNEPFQLLQQKGIFRPKFIGRNAPALILVSKLNSPYEDENDVGASVIKYKYQGKRGDEDNYMNESLRQALALRRPVLFLYETAPSEYTPLYPCYIIADHRAEMYVEIVIGDRYVSLNTSEPDVAISAMRAYKTVLMKQRVHQKVFRSLVLHAYQETCCMCRLNIADLLDAAHIIEDSDENGDPIVQNGLTLCKIHHAAFDRNILGVAPDNTIKVSESVLKKVDGPMLSMGLQSFHDKKILLPKNVKERPDTDRLAVRYRRFLEHS